MEENKTNQDLNTEDSASVEVEKVTNQDEEVLIARENVEIPELEEKRSQFVKKYGMFRILSYISTFIVVAIIVVAYLVVFPLEPNGTWLGIIIIIITLVLSMVFSRMLKARITDTVKDYMSEYNGELNRLVLSKSEITNYVFDFGGQIADDVFAKARLLKNIINTNSRNLIKYEIDGKEVEIADFVAYRPDGKQAKAAFLGKFVNAKLQEKIDGRILLYVKPNPTFFKEAGGPDDVEDLELIIDNDHYSLYASNKEVAKKLSKEARDALLEINPDNELADVTLSMYEDNVAVTLTYSDALMVVPYKENVPGATIRLYQSHVTALNKFFTRL